MADDGRNSGMRGRASRRGATAPEAEAAGAEYEELAAGGDDDGGWKTEIDSITNGTHPALLEELKTHEKTMNAHIAQAQRVHQLQKTNIDALFDCEKKEAADENKAQLEFYRNRLIDGIEEKQRKMAEQTGFRPRGKAADSKAPEKRRRIGLAVFDAATYALPPDQLKADLEEIENAASRYSVRTAAIASEDLRNAGNDIYFDRSRHLLHCNGHSLERDAWVAFIKEGQRIEDRWSITAMNAVEVTLQSNQGTKHKVTLAMLRSGRCVLRPV